MMLMDYLLQLPARAFRWAFQSAAGICMLLFGTRRTIVFILSTQRAGSTLLKALLAEAPDVSHLSEVKFARYRRLNRFRAYYQITRLAPQRIVVLKHPAGVTTRIYPQTPLLPRGRYRYIVLIREPGATIASIRKRLQQIRSEAGVQWDDLFLLEQYWCRIYEGLAQLAASDPASYRIVRYEQLVNDPLVSTAGLFRFLGSTQLEGVDRYHEGDIHWRWGKDDGGPVIQSLQVVATPRPPIDSALGATIRQSSRTQAVRRMYAMPDKQGG